MDQGKMDKMKNMMMNMDFPMSKQEMMDEMQGRGDDDMMDMMKKLPDKNYNSMDEVMDEMGGGADMEDM